MKQSRIFLPALIATALLASPFASAQNPPAAAPQTLITNANIFDGKQPT